MKFIVATVIAFLLFSFADSISAQPRQMANETDCYDQLKDNNYLRAIEVCTAVIAEKADSAPAYRTRGLAYIAKGGFENHSQAEISKNVLKSIRPTSNVITGWDIATEY